jgi:hypothetical protein
VFRYQNNNNFGIGPYNRTGDIFNIQPVLPVKVSDKVMLITRVIQPIIWQPYAQQPTGGQLGFGDMNPTFFLSPANAGKLVVHSRSFKRQGCTRSSWMRFFANETRS